MQVCGISVSLDTIYDKFNVQDCMKKISKMVDMILNDGFLLVNIFYKLCCINQAENYQLHYIQTRAKIH